MKKKPQKRSFSVEFTGHRVDGARRNHPPYAASPVVVAVEATSVEEALNIAARQTLTQFIPKVPGAIANICWSRDVTYPGTGYVSVQYPRGAKLSRPYHMTKRMNAVVTLGNIPIQLCFDFGDTD